MGNIRSVLGQRPLFWLFPGVPPLGNGLDYTLGEGHGGSRSQRSIRKVVGTQSGDVMARLRRQQQEGGGSARNSLEGRRRSASFGRSGNGGQRHHPRVEAMIRTVAQGAGRAGHGDDYTDEELAVMDRA